MCQVFIECTGGWRPCPATPARLILLRPPFCSAPPSCLLRALRVRARVLPPVWPERPPIVVPRPASAEVRRLAPAVHHRLQVDAR
eukprot:4631765-Pleurochrysis_carterae.AAC.3